MHVCIVHYYNICEKKMSLYSTGRGQQILSLFFKFLLFICIMN